MSAFQPEWSWLREASLHRVNTMLINKRELSEQTSILREDISLKDIDSSGLSTVERFHIGQWAAGQESGRHCMLALLEHRRIQHHTKSVSEMEAQSADINADHAEGGNSVTFFMIGKSINLPCQVFSDSGELQEKLFNKSPNAVLKENLNMLASVAMEKGAMSLNAEQLNLALKQLRVQTISSADESYVKDVKQTMEAADENVENGSNETGVTTCGMSSCASKSKKSHVMEAYRLQIVQELIRIYVKQLQGGGQTEDFTQSNGEEAATETPAACCKAEEELLRHQETLEKHLALSLDRVAERSENEPIEDIEKENTILLSYIRQISAMKGLLETQLKDFESSRAFLSLGLPRDATTEQVRKAYHARAIKLHPDKKGGSTEKFQKLQVQYQEIVKQRELEALCREKKFPEAEEHAKCAQQIINEMEANLREIKVATEACGTLGQLNIRWVKKLESFGEMLYPKNITKMMKYILKHLESEDSCANIAEAEAFKSDLSVQSCSSQLLVKPINTICDKLQKLLAAGVSLVSVGRYGRAASNKKSYLQLLEQGVACGLSVSQHIKDVDGVEAQVLSCVERFIDIHGTLVMTKEKLIRYTTSNVLMEMALTVFRSRSITVSMIAEISMLAAVLGADLCSQAQDLVEKVNIEVGEEIRKASMDANIEMENNYSEEDIANLAKVKEQRLKEDQEEDMLRCKAQEIRREEEQRQEQEAENVMDHLNGKIRQLHVQLKLQYVQTLQKINSDAHTFQKKLLRALLNEFGAAGENKVSDLSTIPERIHYDGAEERDRVRVLKLLADFIDRSCLRFRDALVAQRESDALHLIRTDSGVSDKSYEKVSFLSHLHAQFGWMAALDRSKEGLPFCVQKVNQESSYCKHSEEPSIQDEAKESRPAETVSAPVATKQLAFYPDYRSRVLYLSILLDVDTVNSIVYCELKPRLREILMPADTTRHPEDLRIDIEKNAALTANLFCELILQGIEAKKVDRHINT